MVRTRPRSPVTESAAMTRDYLISTARRLSPARLVGWVIHRRVAVLVVVGAITLFFATALPRLSFTTTIYDMVIDDLPETRQWQAFKTVFGSEEMIRVVISGQDVFEDHFFNRVGRLAGSLASIDGVRRTISLPDIKKAVDLSGNWSMETFRQRTAQVPLLRGNLVSEDQKTTAITLVLDERRNHQRTIDQIRQQLTRSHADLTAYQIGMPVVSESLALHTQRDFLRLPPVTFFLVALILVLLFRNLRDALLPLVCVTLTLVWTLGIVAIAGIALSILTMIVPVFLIAVGTAYCMHIVAEYRRQRILATSPEIATQNTFAGITLPTVLAVVTTILSVGSLTISRIAAIRAFAVFACGGMASFAIILFTFLPAALSLIPIPQAPPSDEPIRPGLLQRLTAIIIRIDLDHRKKALALLGAVLAVCLLGLPRLKVETNPVDYFRKGVPIRDAFDHIHHHLSGSFPVSVMVTASEEAWFQEPDAIEALDRFQRFAESLPGVDKAVSLAEYLKLINYATNRYEPAHYKLPEEGFEVRMLLNSYRMMLGKDMLDAFVSTDLSRANIVLFTHTTSSADFLSLKRRIDSHVKRAYPPGTTWDVTGFGIVISASSYQLTSGQVHSLGLTMLMVFAIMFMLFLSWKVGLIAIVPNLFPIAINFGVMGWLGIELSMATSLIASVAIGLAVDDTIHYLVRFNRELKTDLDPRRALEATLAHMAQPIIFTSITIGIGFAALMFSGFEPTAVFGAMMAITLFAALVGDLVLLPILMQYVELVTLWDLVRIRLGRDPGLEIPLFQGLSRTEMHSILMAGTLKAIADGDVLFYKGAASDTMYAVLSGRFEIIDYETKDAAAGACSIQKHIRFAEKGSILGELGLLRAAPRSATVVAVEGGELLPVNWNVIRRLQWLYPPTALKFMNNLLTILCNQVESLTHCLAEESLTDDMTGLCNRKGFCDILQREMRRAARTGATLALCRIKVVFEDPGAEGKNDLVRHLGNSLAGTVRGSDTLGRIDAQEFVILMNGDASNGHQAIQQRIRSTAEGIRDMDPNPCFSIHLSAATIPIDPGLDGNQALASSLAVLDASRRH